jgi:hypothetical protein
VVDRVWVTVVRRWACASTEKDAAAMAPPFFASVSTARARVKGEGWARVWGLRCRPRLHARARAHDVEVMAGREHHAAPLLCTAATTAKLSVNWMEPDVVVWQREFGVYYLPNQLDLVKYDYINYVELHEGYKIVNWSLDWFDLDLKPQSSKVGYPKTKT